MQLSQVAIFTASALYLAAAVDLYLHDKGWLASTWVLYAIASVTVYMAGT